MVGSNKILTVSYGTFSCTLEGFEDSFGTMKAIAEYFRDLAADDRYFGAEPPVPDAEMLARIAEREVSRRVEARMDASGIVLRVGQAAEAAPAASPAPEPAAAAPVVTAPVEPAPVAELPRAEVVAPRMPPAPVAPVIIAPRLVTPRQPESVTEYVAPRPAPVHPDADSVAAKLQRIRAVVGKGSTSFASDDSEDGSATLARLVSDPVETFADIEDAIPAGAAPAEDIAPADDVAAILAEVAGEAEIEPEIDTVIAEVIIKTTEGSVEAEEVFVEPEELVAEAAEAAEPVAEVEKALADKAVAEPTVEPTAPTPIRARVIKMRRADFDRAVAAGMLVEDQKPAALQVETQDESATAHQPADDFADTAPESFAEEEVADDTADLDDLARLDGLVGLPAETTLSADDEAELLAELAAVELEGEDLETLTDTVEPELMADEPAIDAYLDEIPAEAGFEELDEVSGAAIEEIEAVDEDTANDTDLALMNILARVAEPEEVDAPAEAVANEEAMAEHDNGLANVMRAINTDQPAEEDNLFAEEVAEEVEADADNAFSAEADEAEAEEVPVAHAHLRAEPEVDEASLSRIMSEAEAQLSEPEASRRREAIAQLRAAVAATEAARRLGEPETETDTSAEEAFRNDLQQVVRPRRPTAPTTEVRSERPRPAPLKLVASQRVDIPQTAPRAVAAGSTPIRPRRVTVAPNEAAVAPVTLSAVPAAAASQATSFADFAAEMGATSLSDLLEAAAAYTAFVEKSEDFSRPQLLKKVTQLSPDQFSREDGLRSFGTLLREGRIMRTRAGRFQVSEETRFNPERRVG